MKFPWRIVCSCGWATKGTEEKCLKAWSKHEKLHSADVSCWIKVKK